MAVQTKAIQRQELSLVAVPPTPISSQKPKAAPPSLPTPLAVQCATAKAAAVPKGNNPPGEGFACGELFGEPAVSHYKLHFNRRWGTWKEKSVGVVAIMWADMRVRMEDMQLAKLMKAIKERLCEALGEEAVVAIVDDQVGELDRIFVCLLARAEDCIEVRKAWKPMTFGKATATWRDTIDTGSSHMTPRLKACWNPDGLAIDGMSIEFPARWALKDVGPVGKAARCQEGSHWYNFASLFGTVLEAYIVVAARAETVNLVVHYSSNRGPYTAYKALSGRCLYNPMTTADSQNSKAKDLSVLRATYGTYASLLSKATRGVLSSMTLQWTGKAIPLPQGTETEGPIFELYPLGGAIVTSNEVFRMAPWGPQEVKIGKTRKCHLFMSDETAGVSNIHAELTLLAPVKGSARQARLFVCDLSKNGTWVNEQRIPKGQLLELRDGDVLRLAEVPRYAVRRFESLRQCQSAQPANKSDPEFYVPPCPYFIREVNTKAPFSEVPRVPDEDCLPGLCRLSSFAPRAREVLFFKIFLFYNWGGVA
ncbi:unnamed protein product [Durusdinium trenchii]|uniref:FHA domain-containing protein n=1 Tax=Durusdinium trenchii TaxID=1381693 RepID=A0ABP0RJE0_9DINO